MSRQSEGLVLAIATDDEKHFIKRHFGDAECYLIYRYTDESWVFLKKIVNSSEEEQSHADPVKAGSIAKILKKEGAQVLVSKVFGPNIKRMIKNFACVLIHEVSIELGLEKMKDNYQAIVDAWNNGSERSPLKI